MLAKEISTWHAIELSPASRFEARCNFSLPPYLMHSFSSTHNSVDWRFVVRAVPSHRPAVTRVFPAIVFPPRVGPSAGSARILRETEV